MRPFRSFFLTVHGRQYHLRQWGEELPPPAKRASHAPTLVCLHGWGDVGASFQFIADALPATWRLIAPDWRGFGLSARNAEGYWLPDYLADLDALLDALSPERPAILVGHSLGGIVASLYAGIRPARVSRLALLEGLVLWSAPPEQTPARCARWLDARRRDDESFRGYATAEAFAARLRRDNPRLSAARAAFIAAHALERTSEGEYTFAADPHHRWPTPVFFPLADAMTCWREVRAPTLSLTGTESPLMRNANAEPAHYQARLDCFATRHEIHITDSGHNLHHDQPECVARHLIEFLASA